jgi:hypothetical protein
MAARQPADFTADCADYLAVGPQAADSLLLPAARIYLGAPTKSTP